MSKVCPGSIRKVSEFNLKCSFSEEPIKTYPFGIKCPSKYGSGPYQKQTRMSKVNLKNGFVDVRLNDIQD